MLKEETELVNDAIRKLESEMEQNKNFSYVQAIGNFLLQHLESNPAAAEKIMAEGKTIKGSLAELKKEAQKNQVEGCGVLTDEEGFAVALKYYGIDAAAPAPAPAVEKKPAAEFNVSLDDLLK